MLEGLLSSPAEELYSRLLRSGSVIVDRATGLDGDPAVRELVDKRFARWSGPAELVAVAPRLAIETALLGLHRAVKRTHEACLGALEAMPGLQEQYDNLPGRRRGDRRVSVVDPRETAQMAADLLLTAQDEVLLCHPAAAADPPFGGVAEGRPIAEWLRSRQVRVRCVFAKEFLDGAHAQQLLAEYARFGFEVRAVYALPTTMMIVDSRAALIALGGEVPDAVLFRHSAALDLLRAAFELHWDGSVPLVTGDAAGPDHPTPTQLLILRLLAAGLKDESIARHLKVSLRTVRRHITTLCEKAAVPTRFALATKAAQRGWLDPASAYPPPAEITGRRGA